MPTQQSPLQRARNRLGGARSGGKPETIAAAEREYAALKLAAAKAKAAEYEAELDAAAKAAADALPDATPQQCEAVALVLDPGTAAQDGAA